MGTKVYLGIDIGSISTKGVLIDEDNNMICGDYLWTMGDPINAVKKLIKSLTKECSKDIIIKSVGTTGSARKIIGKMLSANVVKNEITAHAIGTISKYPNVKTILEIGGQDSKIIIIENGIVVDYAMNTLCAAGTGSFLSSQAKRLGINIEDIGEIAIKSKNPSKIAARCTVFAESDMIHKAQSGHKKEDLIAGLCNSIVYNYLSNIGKGKKINSQIVFQGGVSKNIGVVKAFENILNQNIIVDENSHLMGAIGIAILSKNNKSNNIPFNINLVNDMFNTISNECPYCPNYCEIISFYKNNILIDSWGNRCDKGLKNLNCKIIS